MKSLENSNAEEILKLIFNLGQNLLTKSRDLKKQIKLSPKERNNYQQAQRLSKKTNSISYDKRQSFAAGRRLSRSGTNRSSMIKSFSSKSLLPDIPTEEIITEPDRITKLEKCNECSNLDLWKFFQLNLKESSSVKDHLKEEQNILIHTIIAFPIAYQKDQKDDLIIDCSDILTKLLEYLEFWNQKNGKMEDILFIIKTFCIILKSANDFDEMVEIQNFFNRLRVTNVLISLISQESEDNYEYLYHLLKLGILLLEDGNLIVQDTIYNIFTEETVGSHFFKKIYHLLSKEILIISKQIIKGKEIKEKDKFGLELLEFLRLFCEGHHENLQNYLRVQPNSKNSYDIVELIIKMLTYIKIDNQNFDIVERIFDTLTEFCQGPCKGNQTKISDSKFLEYAVGLLKNKENEEEEGIKNIRKSSQKTLTQKSGVSQRSLTSVDSDQSKGLSTLNQNFEVSLFI